MTVKMLTLKRAQPFIILLYMYTLFDILNY